MNDEKNSKTGKKQEKSEIKGTMKNCRFLDVYSILPL